RVAFFFFQAEDGIRDWSVTGVQTCALPIFVVLDLAEPSNRADDSLILRNPQLFSQTGAGALDLFEIKAERYYQELFGSSNAVLRSEERRVGKECRCRWSPYQSKNVRRI